MTGGANMRHPRWGEAAIADAGWRLAAASLGALALFAMSAVAVSAVAGTAVGGAAGSGACPPLGGPSPSGITTINFGDSALATPGQAIPVTNQFENDGVVFSYPSCYGFMLPASDSTTPSDGVTAGEVLFQPGGGNPAELEAPPAGYTDPTQQYAVLLGGFGDGLYHGSLIALTAAADSVSMSVVNGGRADVTVELDAYDSADNLLPSASQQSVAAGSVAPLSVTESSAQIKYVTVYVLSTNSHDFTAINAMSVTFPTAVTSSGSSTAHSSSSAQSSSSTQVAPPPSGPSRSSGPVAIIAGALAAVVAGLAVIIGARRRRRHRLTASAENPDPLESAVGHVEVRPRTRIPPRMRIKDMTDRPAWTIRIDSRHPKAVPRVEETPP